MIPLIYIAGPFRGPTPLDVRRNVEAARDVGLRVAECGGFPIIPHCLTGEFDKQLQEAFWIHGHLELLKRCDAIMLMKTWKQSRGARAELAVVQALPEGAMQIFSEEEDLRNNGANVEIWVNYWIAQHSEEASRVGAVQSRSR